MIAYNRMNGGGVLDTIKMFILWIGWFGLIVVSILSIIVFVLSKSLKSDIDEIENA